MDPKSPRTGLRSDKKHLTVRMASNLEFPGADLSIHFMPSFQGIEKTGNFCGKYYLRTCTKSKYGPVLIQFDLSNPSK